MTVIIRNDVEKDDDHSADSHVLDDVDVPYACCDNELVILYSTDYITFLFSKALVYTIHVFTIILSNFSNLGYCRS